MARRYHLKLPSSEGVVCSQSHADLCIVQYMPSDQEIILIKGRLDKSSFSRANIYIYILTWLLGVSEKLTNTVQVYGKKRKKRDFQCTIHTYDETVRKIAAKAGSQDGKSRARFSFDFDNNSSSPCHPLLDQKLSSIFGEGSDDTCKRRSMSQCSQETIR